MPRRAANATGSSCRALMSRRTAGLSTGTGVSRRWRSTGLMLETASMVATVPDPAREREPLRPLVWASAALAAGVLLHLDRVPPWVPVVALVLVAWRLRSEEHTSELQSRLHLVCRLLLQKKKK